MYKKIFLLSLSALWALNGFSQFFSKEYYINSIGGSGILQLNQGSNGNVISSCNLICADTNSCISRLFISPKGDSLDSKESLGFLGFRESTVIRNDTIFYSDNSFSQDSFFYWHFGMMDINGNKLAEFKYKTLHLTEVGIGSFGYVRMNNYGISLVNNNEVILWGEGLDKRQPNPNNVPYRSVFLRLGLDGSQKGDVFWFEANDDTERRMSDATTNIDGNMVFHYEWRSKVNPDSTLRRSVFKILPSDSIVKIADLAVGNIGHDLPKIAVDNVGNYFINTLGQGYLPEFKLDANDITFLTKIDKSGKQIWQRAIPPYPRIGFIFDTSNFKMLRISTTKNGDILCTGSAFVLDSFYNSKLEKKIRYSGNGSFIARFDTDGNLLWRHFVIPHKKDGSIRLNSIYDIQESPDGSIITGGRLERDDDIPGDMYDAWLMRLSPDGCLNETCDHIGKYFDFPDSIVATSDDIIQVLSISPNPAQDHIKITLSDDMALPLRYEVMTTSGQRVEVGSHGSAQALSIAVDRLASGMYLVRMMDSQGNIWIGKWVKD